LRVLASLAIAVLFASDSALAQTTTTVPPAPASATAPVTTDNGDDNPWSFSAAVYNYIVPDGGSYVQPTFTADRGWLHLEARYNYEALDTGSAWVGYNFGGGDKLAWEVTPMVAGVFGKVTAVAPGYKGSLNWWKLALYSEGERVIDTGDSANSFSYTWSELTLAPVESFRFGLVTQRTYTDHAGRDIQDGALVGFTFKKMDLTGYVFNTDDDEPTFVIAVGVRF